MLESILSSLFITGTDTGVGKTHIGVKLAVAWREMGVKVGVFKPAESGCESDVPADAKALLDAAQSGQTLDDVCPYWLRAPLAPAEAAEQEGIDISFIELHLRLRKMKKHFDVILVEGAGGIMVPLTENITYMDLVVAANMPVLIVVANRLGCINHALLTERACLSSGARVAGITMNNISGTQTPDMMSNSSVIERLAVSPMLGSWAYRPEQDACTLDDQEKKVAEAIYSAYQLAISG